MEAIELHSAVRNLMRLFERIKDFEKRVLAREGQLSRANSDAAETIKYLLGNVRNNWRILDYQNTLACEH